MESCKILAFSPSQTSKNTFWEVGKPAATAEAMHKTSLQSYFNYHALEAILIDRIFYGKTKGCQDGNIRKQYKSIYGRMELVVWTS